VIDALAIEDACGQDAVDFSQLDLGELAEHIEHAHHKRLRAELPRLRDLFEHVVGHHGADHPELRSAQAIFDRMAIELDHHMTVEEEAIFPLCKEMAATGAKLNIAPVLDRLGSEHSTTGRELDVIRELLQGFTPPEGACRKYLALLHGLCVLEADLHEHMHKENNILLPKLEALSDTGC
jgi:regulator of cell morphogenesis and NO signaling